MFRDITKEKEIEKNKSEFISFASHQLKTPPTAIKLLTERLLSEKVGELTKKQKEYFNDIRSSNQKMIDLVNIFLNVSRIELGSFAIQVSQNDICKTIDNIINELKPIAFEKELKIEYITSVKNIELLIDESLFRIIFSNILINSINYTKMGGKISVECNIIKRGQNFSNRIFNEDSFCIIITDNGFGIPKNAQDKIFNKFFRADNVKGSKINGTGLGLYIVKLILDHSGGSIWFISNENKGSTFYVSIPMSGMKIKISENKLIN